MSREGKICLLVPAPQLSSCANLPGPQGTPPPIEYRSWTPSETANPSLSHADPGPLIAAPWGLLWAEKERFHNLQAIEGSWQCVCPVFAKLGGQSLNGSPSPPPSSTPRLNQPPTLPTWLGSSPQRLAGLGPQPSSCLVTHRFQFIFFLRGRGLF